MHTREEAIKERAKRLRSNITYRIAIDLDIMQLLGVAKDYYNETEFWTNLDFNSDRLVLCLIEAIEDKDQQIFLAFKEGKLIGFMWVAIVSPVWSCDTIVQDMFLYVDRSCRGLAVSVGLVEEVEEFARACGAKMIFTAANSGIMNNKSASSLYKFLGYNTGGINYYKMITEAS